MYKGDGRFEILQTLLEAAGNCPLKAYIVTREREIIFNKIYSKEKIEISVIETQINIV